MRGENGELVHAHLSKDDSWLFLGLLGMTYYERHERAGLIKDGLASHRGLGTTMIVQVQNVDEVYSRLRAKGVEILCEPTNEFYGDRVFLFLDPFGYEWTVSQPTKLEMH
jgi:uncharacterized glyoxalase superfamily protein PhnB